MESCHGIHRKVTTAPGVAETQKTSARFRRPVGAAVEPNIGVCGAFEATPPGLTAEQTIPVVAVTLEAPTLKFWLHWMKSCRAMVRVAAVPERPEASDNGTFALVS